VRAIAVRDYGEENADAAVEAWRRWSRAAADYVPSDENQYGPCRIGPAYPFNFFGEDLQKGWKPPEGFPLEPGAKFTICHFDFTKPIWGLGCDAVGLEDEQAQKEIELFESQVSDYGKGAAIFREIAASLPEGRRDEAVLHGYRRVVEEEVVEIPPLFQMFRRPARVESIRVGKHVSKRAARKPGDIFEFDLHIA
jgi:hypothetical protein